MRLWKSNRNKSKWYSHWYHPNLLQRRRRLFHSYIPRSLYGATSSEGSTVAEYLPRKLDNAPPLKRIILIARGEESTTVSR
jgi:hypothetical protein